MVFIAFLKKHISGGYEKTAYFKINERRIKCISKSKTIKTKIIKIKTNQQTKIKKEKTN
jgi:hypothetical protein